MTIQEYVDQLNLRYKSGISREHSYRGDLQTLLGELLPDLLITNEPSRTDVGAPDYILTKGKIPVGYIEAKDIGDPDLEGMKRNKEQFERYKTGLPNLIFTDYLNFRVYRDGEFLTSVAIAEIKDGSIVGLTENYNEFENIIKDFGTHVGQTIRSANKLSKMMAGKARILADVIEKALNADEQKQKNKVNETANNTLREQLAAFQNVLIHDISAKEFADIYAQTIAYGMFAARLHDSTLDTFDRHEAAALIPKTNPFLRKLFQYIAGYDLDDRITWVVDGLADIFRATDVDGLLKNFGKATQQQDPIIHFYETFLAEYDPKLRKSRGVWYTPEPVVNFIVRAVDDILKDDFGLKEGLADTSKTKVKVKVPTHDKRHKGGMVEEEREVHKVQILDPAAGTGTFLAEVIKQIHSKFEGQQGIWATYVEEHLIPRLNGFEILMASYAMAHLKLDLLLRETGVEPSGSERFRVYLTNSLEEHHPDTGTLFAGWLSEEANEANHIKRDTPVMVVLGNPPYSGESANKGKWIMKLMEDYKKEPGGKVKLKERNPKWINDDYVKFIRYGQHFIEKNGEGILAFINPHGFLNNPTFRGMRWNLLKTYSKIYTIDLHGNSNRKEKTPEGGKDENVFDIQQGVSINIFIKEKDYSEELAKVFHKDVYGLRESKYGFLNDNDISSIDFEELKNVKPNYFFSLSNYELQKDFHSGIKLTELMPTSTVGVVTSRDDFVIDFNKKKLIKRIEDFENLDSDLLIKKYGINENKSWTVKEAKSDIGNVSNDLVQKISYRPFDERFIYYDDALIERSRREVMQNFLKYENIGLITGRSNKSPTCDHFYISQNLSEAKCGERTTQSAIFPLYLYPEESTQQTLDGKPDRTPNLNKKILGEIAKKLGLKFTPEKEETEGTFAPIDLLDYIYAVLHSPSYREKYKEFLKIDFPRVPYPEDPELFWQLVELGGELRQIHLLEHPVVEKFITTYPVAGSNVISNRLTKTDPGFIPEDDDETIGKVWINDEQYFGKVPKKAWEFYIGGYQPAEKWLKDRRDRKLSIDEIRHYQKIIVALMETDRLMQEIDEVLDV
ncbi:type ISP restriction/modification enzyme [Gracilimonas tropica]|uniref:type ISP restriction/modification enzyme n=1 Tax=Gracilimonas tropica TaxID=454600 RepID=UPI0003797D0D|nr:type ISP restriction/modification enzyme [Gracilimonas tropica]